MIQADPHIFERNLAALARTSPRTCDLLRSAAPSRDVQFAVADDGALTGWILDGGVRRSLASRRTPMEEGRRLADATPIDEAGVFVILGMGVGHHVAAMARRVRKTGVLLCFEPDVGLLRAVLERIDVTAWLNDSNVAIFADARDGASIAATLRGIEGIVALGVKIIEHPGSAARLGEQGKAFAASVTGVVRATRTNVVTTLVQVETTLRNAMMNVDHYLASEGIGPLRDAAHGRPAVVVAAGPSLHRNVRLLAHPGVRERFVIIAVQTALKTLLASGVRPHFVTALDYHEISRRFYEGLTADAVEGITLVAEPKGNAVIMESFPGAIRCPRDAFLDRLLGERLSTAKEEISPGATVAHLAYYLARFMGCDPVILVGQDLGFTDGQYYSADAAIHEVWAGEINPFNTLEMLEWQRIVRGRPTLIRAVDVFGRPIYTDEQMAAYRVQFERDFAADASRGLRVIDATEGGVRKQGAEVMSLRDALAACEPGKAVSLPLPPQRSGLDTTTRESAHERLESIRADVARIEGESRKTAALLRSMFDHFTNRPEVNRLIAEVHAVGQRVQRTQPAFDLVLQLNQTGVLRRIKADRALELSRDLPPIERQRLQIERDIANVLWIADSAAQLASMLGDASAVLRGAPRLSRDPTSTRDEPVVASHRRVAAVIAVDPDRGGLATTRDLSEPFLNGKNLLQCVLHRLARSSHVRDVVVLAEHLDRAQSIVGEPPSNLHLHWRQTDGPALGTRASAIGTARLWTLAAWRGGIGGLTCYDEALSLPATSGALRDLGFDAGVIIGADWALVDPRLIDAVVERYLENPQRHKLTFTQAAPGFGACLVDREILDELAAEMWGAATFASIGGLIGYVPTAPRPDPIARPVCVSCSQAVRDVGLRAIPDSAPRRKLLIDVVGRLGSAALDASSDTIASALAQRIYPGASAMPQQVTLELCTGRRTSGLRRDWLSSFGESPERALLTPETIERVLKDLGRVRTDLAVTFAGAGDPLLHPQWRRYSAMAREFGAAGIHIRTDLTGSTQDVDALLDSGVDVVSVDLMAHSSETYRRIMGVDLYAHVRANLERLIEGRRTLDGTPIPWVVPRITRCDAAQPEIEAFFDHWLLAAGAVVIDPLPRPIPGERIEPLPRPRGAIRRRHRLGMTILSDGTTPVDERDVLGDWPVGDASRESIVNLWQRITEARRAREDELDDHARRAKPRLREPVA